MARGTALLTHEKGDRMTPKPKQNGHDYGGEVIAGAINELAGGVNLEAGTNAINNALQALEQQTKVLIKAKYDPSKPELVARSAAHTAKVIDETTRLIAFAKGGPDSRIETQAAVAEQAAIGEMLQGLTNEQFETFCRWRKEAKEREASE